EYAEDTNLTSLTAEELQDVAGGIFYHTNNDGTNFSIVCNAFGNTNGVSIGDSADLFKEHYIASGINWLGDEVVEINGLEWLKINVEMSTGGTDMKMLQCMALANGNQYFLTFTSEKDKYDDTLSDFEEVLNSFELTK
ncbi:MAG: hypothetical protein K2N71_01805, partial [Oscillospiraceae bacterium]|nr:hypothetical protein [Oscillospiraceae bacterium]